MSEPDGVNVRALLRPKSSGETFVASLFLWNPALSATLTFVLSGTHKFPALWLVSLTISDVVAIACFASATFASWVDHRVLAWRGKPKPDRTFLRYLPVALVVMGVVLPFAFRVGRHVGHVVGVEIEPAGEGTYRTGFAFGLVLAAVFFLYRTRMKAREDAVRADARVRELENRNLEAQVQALRAEMNPHLLFNALNTVASLVHEQPDRAEEVLVRLSELYRGVLRSSGATKHAIADELRTCEAYLAVEKARFGDRLVVHVDVAEDVDVARTQIPVLLLQPFVENAVKHGFASVARAGRIELVLRVDADRVVVTIADDGVGMGNAPNRGAGRAMANARERLALTYGDRGSLVIDSPPSGGTCVTLAFPVEKGGNP
ncbi:MAG: histidine kinase [Polyangiaceae bacterium]